VHQTRFEIKRSQFVYEYTEPLGSTGPRFSTQAHLQAFLKETGASFAVLCPAQAYPKPEFK